MKKLREEKGMMEIGAILVLIVIMSMGIAVYNTAYVRSTNISSSVKEMEVQTFNSQFLAYSGTQVSGSQVKALISAITSSNATNSDHIISVETSTSSGASTASQLTQISQGIRAANKYTVEAEYDNDGYINKIVIK